jgi:hypothetical protein
MAREMSRFREWLRPPRNLLILFVLIVCLPAATLVVLGLRLLDQDHALARQRQIELLDRAADHAVGVLEQKLLEQRKRLETRPCLLTVATDDSVCVVFRASELINFSSQNIVNRGVRCHRFNIAHSRRTESKLSRRTDFLITH